MRGMPENRILPEKHDNQGTRRMHWRVGKVKITKVVELETVGSTRFILPLAEKEEIRKLPWLIPHNGMVRPCSSPASDGSWLGAAKTRSAPCHISIPESP